MNIPAIALSGQKAEFTQVFALYSQRHLLKSDHIEMISRGFSNGAQKPSQRLLCHL